MPVPITAKTNPTAACPWMASNAAMIEVPISDPVQDGPAGGISERCAAASLRFASPEGFGVWDILFIVVLAKVYAPGCIPWGISFKQVSRSEEHTSELQSRFD